MKFETARSAFLGLMLCPVVIACSTVPGHVPGGVATALQPVDLDDASLAGKTVVMSERRGDGLWSVTYLVRDSWEGQHSNVVVTDWSGEQHYDLPVLHGANVEEWAWTENGDFELRNRGSVVTLVFPDMESDPQDIRLLGKRQLLGASGSWAQSSGSLTAAR